MFDAETFDALLVLAFLVVGIGVLLNGKPLEHPGSSEREEKRYSLRYSELPGNINYED